MSELLEKDAHCFTSQLVINELKGQNKRRIISAYEKIRDALTNKYVDLYFSIEDKTNLDKAFIESDKRISKNMKLLFSDNIIDMQDSKVMIEVLFSRNAMKVPPFEKNEKASDKGFNDTLIWANFLDYCSTHKDDFENYVFVTSDNGFLNHDKELKEEFLRIVSRNIDILSFNTVQDLLKHFSIEERIGADLTTNNDFAPKNVEVVEINENTSTEFHNGIFNLLYSEIEMPWEKNFENNLIVYKMFDNDDVIKFADLLSQKKNQFAFFSHVNLADLLKDIGIEAKSIYLTDIISFNNFISLWDKAKKNGQSLLVPFIEFFKVTINQCYKSKELGQDADDLPF